MSPKEQYEQLIRGTAKVLSEKELLTKLEKGQPLRAKLGVDPTAPDIHLGHTVVLEKLRQFQSLGHQAVLIIGDFTATVGDPTGRSSTRPPLSREEVLANAETYTDQAFKILDKDQTEVVYNGEWFRKMNYEEVLKLNARVTMQQMLQREDFKSRIDDAVEVRLHEIQYPIMQGWDSVEVRADVELGGTDQLFNILVGRDMQKSQGMEPQVAMCLPILEGTDGVKKMSKSYGNYVGVDESPSEMFGKTMSKFQSEKTVFNPQSPYGAAKVFAHQITQNYRDAYKIFASNGILFNHESPLRGDNFVTKKIVNSLTNIKKGKQKKLVLGNLYSRRDWGHAADYVVAIHRILQQKKPDDYVIASGKQYSIKQFVNLTALRLGIKLKWIGKGLKEKAITPSKQIIIEVDKKYFRPLEVDHLRGKYTKAKKVLKWKPKTNIYQLIDEMIDEEKKLIKNLKR